MLSETRQSKPKMSTQADAELAKKTLELAWQKPTPFESWNDGIGLWPRNNPSLTLQTSSARTLQANVCLFI